MVAVQSNIKRNFFYQIFYQALISVLPFVTSPYIARVLGSEGVGVYAYTYSVVNWFLILASMGINIYGNRLIAQSRNDQAAMNRNFTSLFIFRLMCACLAMLTYILYLAFVPLKYPIASKLQALCLVNAAIGIDWLFFGLEKFKLTVTRNAAIKLISVLSVFIFVRSKDDIWKYVLIMVMQGLLSSLCVWGFARRYVSFAKVTWVEIWNHAKPMIMLCGVSIATSVFSYMDKIMLESIGTVEELGIYENAWKMIEFPAGFITALSTVLLPRISMELSSGSTEKVDSYLDKSMKFSIIFGSAIMFGVAAISHSFSVLFWGDEFAGSGEIIFYMSVVILVMAWNSVIRTGILLPNQKDSQYVKALVWAAVVNVLLNAALIPHYGGVGAGIGTIGAYLAIWVVQNRYVKGCFEIRKYLVYGIPYLFIGFLMFMAVRMILGAFALGWCALLSAVVIGSLIFVGMTLAKTFLFHDDSCRYLMDIIFSKLSFRKKGREAGNGGKNND